MPSITTNFKNLEKSDILKNASKIYFSQNCECLVCFFKLTRSVYYQLHLYLIKSSLKTIFLKKIYFCILTKKNRGLKDRYTFAH